MFERREVRAIAVGGAVLLLYLTLVLSSGRVDLGQFTTLFVIYIGGSFGLWVAIGLIAILVRIFVAARRSGREPFLAPLLRDAFHARWQRDRGLSLVWPPLLFATLLASYNAFKQAVLPLAGFRFDPWLAGADRMLFLGQDGWRVTHALFGTPAATGAIDTLYHGWFLPMSLGVILCAWLPASTYRLRTQYLLSYMSVWIGLGSVLAFLLPSAGPCFYSHFVGPSPNFDNLLVRLEQIERLNGSPLLALRNQSYLIHAYSGERISIGGGISAMPSVHNGLACLFAIAAWHVNRLLGCLFAAYALVIWVGSIHLGWHYGLDGVVAGVLTFGMWRVCGRIADRLERPLVRPVPKPALA